MNANNSEETVAWVSLPGPLPEVEGYVTKPVLFVVRGEIRAGEYHMNGWFYSKVTDHMDPNGMARGRKDAVESALFGGTRGLPDATHWVYLSEVPKP